MSRRTYKYFRDPIHGFIEVDERFLKIIDSPFFQRLRRIKQTWFSMVLSILGSSIPWVHITWPAS